MKSKKTKIALLAGALSVLVLLGVFFALFFTGVFDKDMQQVSGPVIRFTPETHFLKEEERITMVCDNAPTETYTIYYTLSGASPAEKGKVLKDGGFPLKVREKETVSCYTVRAQAKFADGTWSEETYHSYFVGSKVDERFDINVFSLTILPDDFDGEKGIYTNPKETGDEWERPVYVEVFEPDGKRVIAQDAGIRIHGGASRGKAMKSYRLYAREEYSGAEQKYFEYPFFDGAVDAYGKPIEKYKRLVLRDSGNDNNVTFVRDALVQTLAKEAGFQDTEEVAPMALYINGVYQGFYWTQEYVSEKYFKATYGKYAGDFDKSEHKKNAVDTKEENLEFPELAALDLTKDENFKKVKETIDLENYLFFYAINTLADNEDWPQTNSISYRYRPGEGEGYAPTGVFDGRWRFMIHDDDMTFGLGKNHPYRECLKAVLDKDAVKHHNETLDLLPYSPLFAALMEREDCRQMYIEKVRELTSGVFSPKHMNEVLDKFVKIQANELKYFYSECEYAGKKKLADYKTALQTLREYLNSSEGSIKQQIFDLWGVDIR